MGAVKKIKEDVHTTDSQLTGVAGLAERLLRRFRTLSFGILLTPLMIYLLRLRWACRRFVAYMFLTSFAHFPLAGIRCFNMRLWV